MKGPVKGPTTEKGSSMTTSAAATPAASVMFCGRKKKSVASPAWTMPSPVWETRRTPSRVRKAGTGQWRDP